MKVDGYGDMLSQVKKKPCVGFVMFGSYQGDWVALLDGGSVVELWKGVYGSCSGCDFIEANRDWDTSEIPDKEAEDYFKTEMPFLEIPKESIPDMDLKTFREVFPANVREGIWDYEDAEKELFEALKSVGRS